MRDRETDRQTDRQRDTHTHTHRQRKTETETVEENHIYRLVKPNFTVKTRTVYRGCNVC